MRSFHKIGIGIQPATWLKRRLWHRWFLVSFAKFLIILCWQNTSGPRYKHQNFDPRLPRWFFFSLFIFDLRQKFQHMPPMPFFMTHAKNVWAYLTHVIHAEISPTYPRYSRHPRYLADSQFIKLIHEKYFACP